MGNWAKCLHARSCDGILRVSRSSGHHARTEKARWIVWTNKASETFCKWQRRAKRLTHFALYFVFYPNTTPNRPTKSQSTHCVVVRLRIPHKREGPLLSKLVTCFVFLLRRYSCFLWVRNGSEHCFCTISFGLETGRTNNKSIAHKYFSLGSENWVFCRWNKQRTTSPWLLTETARGLRRPVPLCTTGPLIAFVWEMV